MAPVCRGDQTASLGLIVKGGHLVVQRSPLWLPDHSIAPSHSRFVRTYCLLSGKRPHAGREVCSSVNIPHTRCRGYRNEDHLVLPRFPGPTWWREAGVSIGHSGQSTGAETRELCEGEVTWNVLKEGRYWDRWR